jgi:hypothetical protein
VAVLSICASVFTLMAISIDRWVSLANTIMLSSSSLAPQPYVGPGLT